MADLKGRTIQSFQVIDVYDTVSGTYIPITVRVEIDEKRIAAQLGPKAFRSKSMKSHMASGAIRVSLTDDRPYKEVR